MGQTEAGHGRCQGRGSRPAGKTFRTANQTPVEVLVPGAAKAKATVCFSPNTSQKNKPKNPEAPVDMANVEELIKAANHAVLFLCTGPGNPSIVDAAAAALEAKPRGALTNADRAGNFVVDLHDNGREPDGRRHGPEAQSC